MNLRKAEKTGRPGVAMWPGQSFGGGPLQLWAASQSEDNQPAVFADSRPPHSHSFAACRALHCRPYRPRGPLRPSRALLPL